MNGPWKVMGSKDYQIVFIFTHPNSAILYVLCSVYISGGASFTHLGTLAGIYF